MQTHPLKTHAPLPPHTRLPLTLTLQTTIPCPNQPRARYQTRRDSAYTPGSRAHGSDSNWPTPSCLPRLTDPSLPTETAVQALAQVVPQALCLLTDPGASPGGSAWYHLPLLLGPVNDNYLFSGICPLICWPRHTWIINTAYILNPPALSHGSSLPEQSFLTSCPGRLLHLPLLQLLRSWPSTHLVCVTELTTA